MSDRGNPALGCTRAGRQRWSFGGGSPPVANLATCAAVLFIGGPSGARPPPGFRELLEETLQRYHARLVDAAAVIQAMIEIRKEMEGDDQRTAERGLDEDELAFYDAVAANLEGIYDQQFLSGLIHQVVESVKRNLKVDWTKPHRESVKAGVRLAVKRVLKKNEIRAEDMDRFVEVILEQAEALYGDWPRAA